MTASDPKSPSVARVYDAVLGDPRSAASDRALAAELAAISPQLAEIAAEGRDFQARAVSWLAGQGVTQFADLGCGMPTAPNTHETAQKTAPDATVAYVDRDPAVVERMSAFTAPGSGVMAVTADAGDPAATRAALDDILDFTKPVAVLMCALLHFYEAGAAREIVAGHASALAPGSYLVVSVIGAGGPVMDRLIPAYSAAIAPLYPYTAEETASLFDGLELIPPGVAAQDTWRPGETEAPTPDPSRDFFGHVAVACVGPA